MSFDPSARLRAADVATLYCEAHRDFRDALRAARYAIATAGDDSPAASLAYARAAIASTVLSLATHAAGAGKVGRARARHLARLRSAD